MSSQQTYPRQSVRLTTRKAAIIAGTLLLLSLLVLPVFRRATPQSTLTIAGQDQNGNPVTGFSITATDPAGNVMTVTAPTSISLNSGWSYTILVQSPASCTFAYWTVVNSVSNPLHASITGPLSMVAVFNCGASPSSLTVTSEAIGGGAITGYYTVTYSSSGSLMATGFTPTTFGVTSGNTYMVLADSYGSCNFLNWSDGITANPRPVTISSTPSILTAVYDCA